jgi:hypothetical protein
MAKVKGMPYEEKYRMVIDNLKLIESFELPFVQKHLGGQAVADFKSTVQEGAKLIPDGASFEEKYEIAYSNFISRGKSAYSFIRKRMGEEGIRKLERANVEALKRKNAGPAFFLLRLMRAISPSLAFTMMSPKMAYQLQWITPFSTSELSKHRVLFSIPHCKVLDFPETEDLCLGACQRTYPAWVAEQFKVKMEFDRQGNSCTCTLTPLR